MKYLLVLGVVLIAVFIWRQQRRAETLQRPSGRQSAKRAASLPEDMVACAHCGLHLPMADALPRGSQLYCSAEHRSLGPSPH